MDVDGLLGQAWHADRVWTYDYPGRSLWAGNAGDPEGVAPPHTVRLGFRTVADGSRPCAFPRIDAVVDGESLPFLFDTGATLKLTPEAQGQIGDGGPVLRGTCFIIDSVLRRWRGRHPDWPVIPRGDALGHGTLIRVPTVTVAGYAVGPVWFTSRPTDDFRAVLADGMDMPVDGALGGDLFQHFRIVVDYPHAKAIFFRPA